MKIRGKGSANFGASGCATWGAFQPPLEAWIFALQEPRISTISRCIQDALQRCNLLPKILLNAHVPKIDLRGALERKSFSFKP